MRRTLVVALLVVAWISLPRAQERGLDAPLKAFRIPNPVPACALATLMLDLAKSARIAIGFESTVECGGKWVDLTTPAVLATSQDVTDLTPRQVLSFLFTQHQIYRWMEIDGVVVVRPIRAWDDGVTVLNEPARAFIRTAANMRDAVNAVLGSVVSPWVPRLGAPIGSRQLDRRIPIAFRGGTMLDALNTVIVANGEASWEVEYTLVKHPSEMNIFTSIHTQDGSILGVGAYLSQFKTGKR